MTGEKDLFEQLSQPSPDAPSALISTIGFILTAIVTSLPGDPFLTLTSISVYFILRFLFVVSYLRWRKKKGQPATFSPSHQGFFVILGVLLVILIPLNRKQLFVMAAQYRHGSIVKVMLVCGTDVDSQDEDGRTALMAASWRNDVQTVEVLLNRNAQVDLKDKNGSTALMKATSPGRKTIARMLLNKGADVNIQDNYGLNALMWAVQNEDEEIISLLLKESPDIDAENCTGLTALMIASMRGNVGCVQLLLDKKPNVHIKDQSGKTAMMWAMEGEQVNVVNILKNAER
jgi:ankyrin repeat protein